MNKNKVAQAIKAAIKELFPYDEDVADQSVVAGDPWGWASGSSLATIQTEDGLECLNYYDRDWIGNSLKIQAHVKKNTGLDIFIECINCCIHGVYEG